MVAMVPLLTPVGGYHTTVYNHITMVLTPLRDHGKTMVEPHFILQGNNSGYTQESVVPAVLGKSYDTHNSLADATILRDVVVHCEIPQNSMLKHSFTTQWAERYVIYLQEQNSRIGSFHPLAQEKIISKGMLTTMARSGLEYRHLCIAYQRGGRDASLSSLLTELNSNNSVRVTNRKNVLKAICDYFERIHYLEHHCRICTGK